MRVNGDLGIYTLIDNPSLIQLTQSMASQTRIVVHPPSIVSCVFTKRFLNNEKSEIQINVGLIHNVGVRYIKILKREQTRVLRVY